MWVFREERLCGLLLSGSTRLHYCPLPAVWLVPCHRQVRWWQPALRLASSFCLASKIYWHFLGMFAFSPFTSLSQTCHDSCECLCLSVQLFWSNNVDHWSKCCGCFVTLPEVLALQRGEGGLNSALCCLAVCLKPGFRQGKSIAKQKPKHLLIPESHIDKPHVKSNIHQAS